MTNPHQQSIKLWDKYKNAKTRKEKADANYELQEFKRRQASGIEEPAQSDIDSQTQDMLNESGGKIV